MDCGELTANLARLRLQVRPLDGSIVKESWTGRGVGLPIAVAVIVEFPKVPTLALTERGSAVSLKGVKKNSWPGGTTFKSSQLLVVPVLFESPL